MKRGRTDAELAEAFRRLMQGDDDVVTSYWKSIPLPVEIDEESRRAAQRHLRRICIDLLKGRSGIVDLGMDDVTIANPPPGLWLKLASEADDSIWDKPLVERSEV